MDDKFLSDLEFPQVLELLRSETVTSPGAALATGLRPSFDPEEVARSNALSVEALRYLESRGALPFGTVPDPQPPLERLGLEGSTLDALEIRDLLIIMKAARSLKSSLAEVRADFPRLWDLARDLPDVGNLIRFLDGKIGGSGEVLDHASDDLRDLRQAIQRRTTHLQEMLETLLGQAEISRALQDDFVSIRSNRHVIPIRAEARTLLPGIVHGVSGSGATVFLEPLETVDLNNEIVTLRDRESAEVKRLLQEYTDLLRGRLPDLRSLRDGIARLDLVMAKGRLGRALKARAAEPCVSGDLMLSGARHPMVEASLRSQGGAMTPLDLSLPAGTRVLMLSGPNTGGKTVTLKTVGLLSLMFQSGLLVPADRASFPVFRRVFIEVGDHQSIPDRLSTFSARVKTIALMVETLELPALVLLDEVGTGTDPEDGMALGVAIVDYFRARGATVMATTHLEALKAYAASTDGCANASMHFDEATLTPTYRLIQGIPGRSGGLDIAERLGLPLQMLKSARARRGRSGQLISEYLGHLQDLTADLDTRLRAVSEDQARLVSERDEMERTAARREESVRKALATEIELALASIREEGERYLASLKDRELAQRMRREEMRAAERLRAEARRLIRRVSGPSSPAGTPSHDIRPGSNVFVRGLGTRGTVVEVRGEQVELQVRGKRLKVSRLDCIMDDARGGSESRHPPRLGPGVTLERTTAPVREEIHLRGLTVEEALDQVDKFLDDAYLGTLHRVRLVHGVGSGRLKRAVGEFLADHPHVERFTSAPADQGGVGVTIVTLKI